MLQIILLLKMDRIFSYLDLKILYKLHHIFFYCGNKKKKSIYRYIFDVDVAAYQYNKNYIIFRDIIMTSVKNKITKFVRKHETRLNQKFCSNSATS